MKIGIYISLLLFAFQNVKAQEFSALAERNEMLIGEQIQFTLKLEYPGSLAEAIINWPNLTDKLTEEFEIIKASEVNERVIDADIPLLCKEQHFIITSFDTGFLVIPPFELFINDSTLETLPQLIQVLTVEVDTSKGIMDIKPIYEVDYSFGDRFNDFLSWMKENWYIPLSLAVLLALLFLLYRRWKKNKDKNPFVFQLPAHIVAFQKLDELSGKKLWKKGMTKQHFVELTQIIRIYIENRYGVRALEKTTQEIIDGLKLEPISQEQKETLRNLLSMADLVKFAKAQPQEQDNELSLKKAYLFIEDTKFTDEEKEYIKEQFKNAKNNNDNR